MAIAAGTRLGPYEVGDLLGAGGMGEVYKALDLRLDRCVVIKVLPTHLSSKPALRERFEREARAISAIGHPHICALYDVGEWDSLPRPALPGAAEDDDRTQPELGGKVAYLVMEYLEGGTLAERIARGPLPLEQVCRYGLEIASALDKAHRAGIVHRDLKPGNVMLTKSGAKLLDFGLAKYARPQAPAGEAISLATELRPLTEEGTIVGTFQYMAPEQLEGLEADARTDIFALGCLLYEMTTGKRPFEGKSRASLIAAIVSGTPTPVSALRPLAPPMLQHLINKCLAKDPDDRWQSAHDIAEELKWIGEGGSQVGAAAVVVAGKRPGLWFALIGVALLAAAFAAMANHYRARLAHRPAIRAAILPPENGVFRFLGSFGPPALSQDGTRVVFAAALEGQPVQLWVRPIDSLEVVPLAGTERPSFPFWSPDGSAIGYFSQGKLKRVPASGGAGFTLCDAPDARGGSWGKGDQILFGGRSGPIAAVSVSGGASRTVTSLGLSRGETSHRWPAFLPDGEHFLYLAAITGAMHDENELVASSLSGALRKVVMRTSSNVAYVDGHLFFAQGNVLMAQKFDPRSLELLGGPIPLIDSLQYDSQFSQGVFSLSASGVLVYQSGKARMVSTIQRLDRTGKLLATIGGVESHLGIRLAPDGRSLAAMIFDLQTGNDDVWIYDVTTGNKRRLTLGPKGIGAPVPRSPDAFAVWSTDSQSIIFASDRSGNRNIYIKGSSGLQNERLLFGASTAEETPTSVTPDGKHLIVTIETRDSRTKADIWSIPLFGGKAVPLLQSPARETMGRISPDGRWIAYQSDELGHWEIYVSAFPSMEGTWQVSRGAATNPGWSPDGKSLYYIAEDEKLMKVAVSTERGFEPAAPEALFAPRWIPNQKSYDLAGPDEFLVSVMADEERGAPLTLVSNWKSMLPARQ